MNKKYKPWEGPRNLYESFSGYLAQGDKLLDLGIGAGQCAGKFHNLGVNTTGIDINISALRLSKKKDISSLVQSDIRQGLPFKSDSFTHVISCGVFLYFNELGSIFSEVSRVIEKGGYFAFNVREHQEGLTARETNVCLFPHNFNYVNRELGNNSFRVLHHHPFEGYTSSIEQSVVNMRTYIARSIR